MKECFVEKSFYASSRKLIAQANAIAAEYLKQGYSLTLRQLYYQFVARGYLPNTVNNYKKLGSVINDARLAGLIDWALIEDRTRWLRERRTWFTPGEFIQDLVPTYAENLWRGQEYYCEVWIEKDALAGVIERVCSQWRVPYFPCRGYASQSELYEAGKRLSNKFEEHSAIQIFHLGDHDPSGIDMTRDNRDRLSMFTGREIQLERLALNMDQVDQYKPPENPAKETDSRFADYAEIYGESSWELDALDPPVINSIVGNAIQGVLDVDLFQERAASEEANRSDIELVSDNWDRVVEGLHNE